MGKDHLCQWIVNKLYFKCLTEIWKNCCIFLATLWVLSALLPQQHPAEGRFEWINRAWVYSRLCWLWLRALCSAGFQMTPLWKSFLPPWMLHLVKVRQKEWRDPLFPEFCYANKGEATKKRSEEAMFNSAPLKPKGTNTSPWQILKEILHIERTLIFKLRWIVFSF